MTETIDLNFYLASPKKGWEQPCALCGRMLNDGNKQVTVEQEFFDQVPTMLLIRVWHADCFSEYWSMK